MADCKLCGCTGWLFWTGPDGLCRNCSNLAGNDMRQRASLAESAQQAAQATLNPHSKIANLDQAVSQLKALADYEEKGIRTPIGAASMQLHQTQAQRDALLLKTAREEALETMQRVRDLADPEAKLKLLDAYRIKLREYRARCGDGPSIEILDKRVRTGSYRIRLSRSLELAREAETGGDEERAKRLYAEALDCLDKEGKTDPSYRKQRERVSKQLNALSRAS